MGVVQDVADVPVIFAVEGDRVTVRYTLEGDEYAGWIPADRLSGRIREEFLYVSCVAPLEALARPRVIDRDGIFSPKELAWADGFYEAEIASRNRRARFMALPEFVRRDGGGVLAARLACYLDLPCDHVGLLEGLAAAHLRLAEEA